MKPLRSLMRKKEKLIGFFFIFYFSFYFLFIFFSFFISFFLISLQTTPSHFDLFRKIDIWTHKAKSTLELIWFLFQFEFYYLFIYFFISLAFFFHKGSWWNSRVDESFSKC